MPPRIGAPATFFLWVVLAWRVKLLRDLLRDIAYRFMFVSLVKGLAPLV